MFMDLSQAPDDALGLILQFVPASDLMKACILVSKQWNRVLTEKGFWRDKMELDGCKWEWPKLAGLSLQTLAFMAVKRPFGRNLIKDIWNCSKAEGCELDPRWLCSNPIGFEQKIRYEVPPVFVDGQPDGEMSPDDSPVLACLAIGYIGYSKQITIGLADEGLNDQIMDSIRPTIVVSQLVGNRRDYQSFYQMECRLCKDAHVYDTRYNWKPIVEQGKKGRHNEAHDENGHCLEASLEIEFYEGDAECWNELKHEFNNYPAGMRYLTIRIHCGGENGQLGTGNYSLKMANTGVKVLCHKNAADYQ